ncbi:hypothetical protein C8R45DRAFT_161142 [Mycena sanguinolenta]|nr:hypothetical protein C8R45DRAFT_161142 [Mycena sanguinolenta]
MRMDLGQYFYCGRPIRLATVTPPLFSPDKNKGDAILDCILTLGFPLFCHCIPTPCFRHVIQPIHTLMALVARLQKLRFTSVRSRERVPRHYLVLESALFVRALGGRRCALYDVGGGGESGEGAGAGAGGASAHDLPLCADRSQTCSIHVQTASSHDASHTQAAQNSSDSSSPHLSGHVAVRLGSRRRETTTAAVGHGENVYCGWDYSYQQFIENRTPLADREGRKG